MGYTLALYPKGDVFMPRSLMKTLARLSNKVLLPCLIIFALGTGLTLENVGRMAIIVPYCFILLFLSYFLAWTVGSFIHEDDPHLLRGVAVAVGSPNSIAFPLILMDSLCSLNEDLSSQYDNVEMCFAEATSMLFVYGIGWFLVFWGYGYPMLETLLDKETGEEYGPGVLKERLHSPAMTSSKKEDEEEKEDDSELSWTDRMMKRSYLFRIFYRVVSSVNIQFTMIGIIIGISAPLRDALFFDFTALTPVGSTIQTIGSPVLALDCLIMAATLASVDVAQIWTVTREKDHGEAKGEEKDDPGDTNEDQALTMSVPARDIELVKKGGSNARPRSGSSGSNGSMGGGVVFLARTESSWAATPGSLRGTSR